MKKLVLILTLSNALALGQTEPPAATAETAKKAAIEGVVVNEKTKEPLRRAEVSLYHSGAGGGMMGGGNSAYSAVTDAAGKFRIETIDPGEYSLLLRKTGFVNARSSSGFSARSLKLGAGEELTDLRYSLLPQAIVTGRVVDDEGEPVQGAAVFLLRQHYRHGAMNVMPAGQASTNDRGEYRIINVLPGKYYLQVNVQRMAMGAGAMPSPAAANGAPRTAFVSTYFPSATDLAQATKIEPQAGLELPGQDITLRKEKVVKVSGKVLDANGSPAKQTYVMLSVADGFMNNFMMGSQVDEKGAFTINNVRPGQYTAIANRIDGEGVLSAQTTLTVGDSDMPNVVLQMQPGLEVKGVIVLEGSEKKDFDFSGMFLGLEPVESRFGGNGAQPKSDGTFTIPRVSPGKCTLSVHTNGGEGYVQSIQAGGEDVLGKQVEATNLAASGVRVVMRLDSAKVTGTLEIPEDRKANLRSPTVVLVPADPQLRDGSQFNVAQTDQANAFEVKNLRPGDYLAFAFEHYEYSSMEDPEVLAALESKATKVSLARGESKQLDLKLTPWPEQFADRLP